MKRSAKHLKKYQFGSDTRNQLIGNRPELTPNNVPSYTWANVNPLVTPPIPMNVTANKFVPNQDDNVSTHTQPSLMEEDLAHETPQGRSRRFPGILDTNRTEFHDGFKAFNALALGVTGIASSVNNLRATQQENQEYLDSLQPVGWENMERYGLNSNPIFTKFGGNVSKYQMGGRPTTADSLALYNNAVSTLKYYQGSGKYEQTGKKKYSAKEQQKAIEDFKFAKGYYGPKETVNNPDLSIYYKPVNNNQYFQREIANTFLDTDAPMTLYDRRVKPHSSLVFDRKIGREYDKEIKKRGIHLNSNEAQALLREIQIKDPLWGDGVEIPMYDPIGIKPWAMLTAKEREIREKRYGQPIPPIPVAGRSNIGVERQNRLSQDFTPNTFKPFVTPQGQGKTNYSFTYPTFKGDRDQKSIYFNSKDELDAFVKDNVVNASGQGNKDNFTYTGYIKQYKTGGSVKGLPKSMKGFANVEAEKGEVIQEFDGNVEQIDPNGKTHEQGGEFMPNVHRVLENTSDLRKDKNSKYLKLSPLEVKDLTGIDVKKPMSHSKAMVKASEQYGDKKQKIVKKIELAGKDKNVIDKYAEESIKLNIEHFSALPTEEQLFDNLFNHQEMVKANNDIPSPSSAKFGKYIPKAQVGINAYKGNRTGMRTPAGNYDAFPGDLQSYLNALKTRGFNFEGITSNADLQRALYQQKLDNGQFDDIRNMWQEGMHQAGMKRAQQLGFVDSKGRFNPGVLESETHLRELGDLYPDNILGPRLLSLAGNNVTPPRKWTDNQIPGELEELPNPQNLDTSIQNTTSFQQNPQSRFNEPLRWFDVASPIGTYMSAIERLPAKYNPVEFNQLRYKLQDPTAQLQQNQADYNAAVQAVQNSDAGGAGLANIANLASRKYALNQQVLGNTENQNAQIKNQEILYNTQVRDKQSVADQQAREVFENKVLTGKAKQQEQKLTALDSLYKTFAENRALNRNGNLMMKFSRAFDQYGNYNGYQTKFSINPTAGVSTTPTGKIDPAGGIQNLTPGKSYYNRRSGKVLRFDGVNLVEMKN